MINKTCFICRERMESTDEIWVIIEKLDNFEYEIEVKGYLVSLGDNLDYKI